MEALQHWQNTGAYFQFQGHDIFYRTEGTQDKPVLLLIHGFPTSSWDWQKIWHNLSQHFHLVTLDMLGFGFSDKPKQDYLITQQADIYDALMQKLEISNYHILAHDYGDTVAQELLARHHQSGKILSVVFSNGGLFPETHYPALIQKLLISPIGFLVNKLNSYRTFEKNLNKVCLGHLSEQELKEYWYLINYKKGKNVLYKLITYMSQRQKHRERWVGVIQTTQVPIHLVDGLLDPVSGAHMVRRYEELIPNPSVVELENCGHYPQVEEPIKFYEAALTFWKKHI